MNKTDKKILDYLDRATVLYAETIKDVNAKAFSWKDRDYITSNSNTIATVEIAKMIQREELK